MYRKKAPRPFGDRILRGFRAAITARRRRHVVAGSGAIVGFTGVLAAGSAIGVWVFVAGPETSSGDHAWLIAGLATGALLLVWAFRMKRVLVVDVDDATVTLITRGLFLTRRRTMTLAAMGEPRVETTPEDNFNTLVFGPTNDPVSLNGPFGEEAREFLVTARAEAQELAVQRRTKAGPVGGDDD